MSIFAWSQSLIHQVIYSVERYSGRSEAIDEESQSLIHQVIYSVSLALGSMPRAKEMSLNPLFIRSSIPLARP